MDALQNATLNTGASGSQQVTFIVAGNNTYNIGALTGSDDLAIGANTISVGSKAVDTTFSGAISGTGGLTKVGANTLTLYAANTYRGTTVISGGTLSVANTSGSATGTNTVSLTGASLASGTPAGGGNGSIAGTVTTSGASPRIRPGNVGQLGTLALGALTLGGTNPTMDFDLSGSSQTQGGGVNDLVVVTNALTLNADTAIRATLSSTPSGTVSYNVITYGTKAGASSFTVSTSDITPTPTSASLNQASSPIQLVLTYGGATLNAFRIYAANSAPTAGVSDQLTLCAVNADGATNSSVSSAIPLIFSGLNNAPGGAVPTVTDNTGTARNLGQPTTITFANGVSTAGGLLVAKKAETATLHVTDGAHTDQSAGGNGGASLILSAGRGRRPGDASSAFRHGLCEYAVRPAASGCGQRRLRQLADR